MSFSSSRDYLQHQYGNASYLDARVALHQLYSTHPQEWHAWVFDQLELPPQARILELGCGPGHLWRSNAERILVGWRVCLSDLSPGMIEEAQSNLRAGEGGRGQTFSFFVHDAQALPYPASTFDAVVANHMLYHVADKARAFAEIRRVLIPGGRLYAATNGQDHMRELRELSRRVRPEAERQVGSVGASFTLENGTQQLRPWFSQVTCVRQENGLRVPEIEPVLAYLASTHALSDAAMDECTVLLGRELDEHGVIEIAKDSGLFMGVQD
jgi:ubiquinone/menaquinone biosynthesis C-methylase UbiE